MGLHEKYQKLVKELKIRAICMSGKIKLIMRMLVFESIKLNKKWNFIDHFQ